MAAIAAILLLGACSGTATDDADEVGSTRSASPGGGAEQSPEPTGATPAVPRPDPDRDPAGPGEYRAGLAASVDLPAAAPRAAVVLVPGGGWRSADPLGLQPLSERLVTEGFGVVTITYRTAGTGAVYPAPADDVACAVAFAAEQMPGVPVVAVGHSAGAHLAALVALAPERGNACPYPTHPADGVVGLAGPYDVAATYGLAGVLFGAPLDQEPELWADGNPLTWAAERPEVPFLLVHGDQDQVVPVSFSTGLATALEATGHDVSVQVLPGVDHVEVVDPTVIGDVVVDWLTTADLLRP